jgi:DNA-nicking Smr family endonuclease
MTGKGERRPPASDDDAALWHRLTEGVKPLARRPKPAPAKPPAARPAAAPARKPVPPPPAPRSPSGPGLDKRTAERLRRGDMPIEARLDLHGLTQAEAHAALARFVAAQHAAGRRCLLVITGKGTPRAAADQGIMPERRGVLRELVPRWLKEPALAERVLATAPAQPRHGGGGALYLLLRRRREPEPA